MKGSLYKKIVAFSIVASVTILLLLTVFIFVFYRSITNSTYSHRMEKCAEMVQSIYDNYNLNFTEFPAYRISAKRFREDLLNACNSFELKYLYLYRPGHKDGTRLYYFSVASDPQEDMTIATDRGYGTVVNIPFRDIEQKIWDGEVPNGNILNSNNYGTYYTWYYPIYDSMGNVTALLGLDYDASDLLTSAVTTGLLFLLPVVAVVIILVILLLFEMRTRVFKPMRSLSEKMYSFEPTAPLDLSDIKRVGEIGDITNSFETMSDSIKEYISDIRALTEERANASAELNVARKIQMGMVPEHFELNDRFYEVSAFACPAKEVGGDFYSCFASGRYLYLMIGDVSGKGIAASMFMSMAMSVVREKLRSGLSPAEALNTSNDILCSENPEGMFVTLFAVIYDSFTGEIRYANAGHTKPLLISSENRFLEPDPGIALGLFEDADIKDDCLFLNKGEGFLIYTDGATDGVNSDKEFFGEDRILKTADPSLGAGNTKVLVDSIHSFVEDNPQFDDTTIITLFRSEEPSRLVRKELSVDLEAYDEIKDEMIGMIGLNPTSRKILLACEEVYANIVDYSGADSASALCALSESTFIVRFEDNGKAFDPINTVIPRKSFEEMDTGGMGISIVKQIATEVTYNRICDKNILTMMFEV